MTAAAAVKRLGFTPVPHISVRRIKSQQLLEEYLSGLRDIGASENVLVIGGDPTVPAGPYPGSLAVIESGILQRHGVKHISIAGHPSGDPNIPADVLMPAMADKAVALAKLNTPGAIITQLDFDVDRVLQWVADVRAYGVDLPIRVGVPGPASVKLHFYTFGCLKTTAEWIAAHAQGC